MSQPISGHPAYLIVAHDTAPGDGEVYVVNACDNANEAYTLLCRYKIARSAEDDTLDTLYFILPIDVEILRMIRGL